MTKSNKKNNVRPELQLLNPGQTNEVHQYSINILENTGIKVESKTTSEESADNIKKERIILINRFHKI